MFKIKFKFIYLALFTSLLFLFANGGDTNKKTTEKFYSNDYEVHFVVHKTKKSKKEKFLERKIKRIQKKINRFVEKNDEDKSIAGKVIGILLLIILLWLLVGGIAGAALLFGFLPILFGQSPSASLGTSLAVANPALGIFLRFFLALIIFVIINSSIQKKEQQKG